MRLDEVGKWLSVEKKIRTGPSTEPWGTLYERYETRDSWPSTTTDCVLLVLCQRGVKVTQLIMTACLPSGRRDRV